MNPVHFSTILGSKCEFLSQRRNKEKKETKVSILCASICNNRLEFLISLLLVRVQE